MSNSGKKRFGFGLFAAALVLFCSACATAAPANIAYNYTINQNIPSGSLVSADKTKPGVVVPSNLDNGGQLIGIVIASSGNTAKVAVSGTVPALVASLNGDIKVGDQVGVSPFNGVGIKASAGSRAVGLAQAAFTTGSKGAVSMRVTNRAGKSTTIKVGYVPVTIAISTTASPVKTGTSGLQKLAVAITGHSIPTVRLVISLITAVAAVIILVIMIYGSIYSGIVAVGRNPLAKNNIFRALISVIGLSLLLAGFAGALIYFLLR